jgi:hypothetical protein
MYNYYRHNPPGRRFRKRGDRAVRKPQKLISIYDDYKVETVPVGEAIERLKAWITAHNLDDSDIDIYAEKVYQDMEMIVISAEGTTLHNIFNHGMTAYAAKLVEAFNAFANDFLGYEVQLTSWSITLYPMDYDY